VPTVLVHGAASLVLSEADVEELETLNGAPQVVHIEGAGHMVPWDDLDGMLNVARTVLNGSPASPGSV
jgi:N-formylmaleamate deformylase